MPAIPAVKADRGRSLAYDRASYLPSSVIPYKTEAFQTDAFPLRRVPDPFQNAHMGISKREQVIINLAVSVLREAMMKAGEQPIDTLHTRLALRCLLPYCRDRDHLTLFWTSGSFGNAIGRSQGTNAAFNGIVRQLRLSGAWQNS